MSAPNFQNTIVVAIKQGGTAEAVIGDMIDMVDSTINYSLSFITKWSPWGEIVKESNISIRTLETDEENFYNSKTIDSSRDTVRLGTQGETLT